MRETSISDVHGLIEAAKAAADDFRGAVWYRGQQLDYPLKPSALRGYDDRAQRNMIWQFMREAQSRHRGCPGRNEPCEWLCLMQHHALPTRLLDWSRSILTAAFFATSYGVESGNGVIWALAPDRLSLREGGERRIYGADDEPVKELFEAVFGDVKQLPAALPLLAPEIDPKMLMQQAAFTVHGTQQALNECVRCDEYLVKLVIPAEAKVSIAADLDLLAINQAMLFPDLYNLAAYIKSRAR